MPCELCDQPGGEMLWQDDLCRVVLVGDAHYPGFCRVILNRHVKEMTDLSEAERARLMSVVFAVEAAVRATVQPDKINLASLGNVVPHLHWHVIPRFADDRHFPNPIWGEVKRSDQVARAIPDLFLELKTALRETLDRH
jgi:diadenosine tetraphosphate (Ap4A) HIT family hydrolase